MKRCTCCGEVKPLEAFHYDKQAKGRRRSRCKVCISGYNRSEKAAAARQRFYAKRDPLHIEKTRVRALTVHLIQTGEIKPGVCEICGSTHVMALHTNFDDPYAVRWFCAEHHSEHRRNLSRRRVADNSLPN